MYTYYYYFYYYDSYIPRTSLPQARTVARKLLNIICLRSRWVFEHSKGLSEPVQASGRDAYPQRAPVHSIISLQNTSHPQNDALRQYQKCSCQLKLNLDSCLVRSCVTHLDNQFPSLVCNLRQRSPFLLRKPLLEGHFRRGQGKGSPAQGRSKLGFHA